MAVTVGIDEVGRGCWAGPLVAAAVILPETFVAEHPKLLRDSKKMTKKQRSHAVTILQSQVKSIGVGWVTPGEIDRFGLTKSVRLAMLRAMKQLHMATSTYDQIVIDGNYNFLQDVQGLSTDSIVTIVRADDQVPAVSAASVIAKVARDEYMARLADKYPGYGFEAHVGYGTSKHLEALKAYGATPVHRLSFAPLQPFLDK